MEEISLYKMYVVKGGYQKASTESMLSSIKNGFILDKDIPLSEFIQVLNYIEDRKITTGDLSHTLFSVKDLDRLKQDEKIIKQILHYVSGGNYGVYKFTYNKKPISIDVIKVVTKAELQKAIEEDIYSDKPLQSNKIKGIFKLIHEYRIPIVFKNIKNREFKAYLIANTTKKIEGLTGDDVLRAIYILANLYNDEDGEIDTLLINSSEARWTMKCANDCVQITKMLITYKNELAEVFNRRKDLILSLKSDINRKAINKIAKLSKKLHVPVGTPRSQTVITDFLNGGYIDIHALTNTEIFKILYAISTRKLPLPTRAFMIRNSKVYVKDNPDILDKDKTNINLEKLEKLEYILTQELSGRLSYLNGKVIKYPVYLDYALPISEKMSCGNVPFGTLIRRSDSSKVLTVGMYWKNEWGSRDLDLSSIDLKGNRVGWGQSSTYENGVLFSGDITNAPKGAIECMGNPNKEPVILVNNIFNGELGSKFKVIVGEYNKDDIDEDTIFLENTKFNFDYKFQGAKRSCVLGALTEDEFILYPANLGSYRVSGDKDNSMIHYMIAPRLRMRYLLENIAGATLVDVGECDYDLSLSKVTFKDLHDLLNKTIYDEINEQKVLTNY